MFTSKTPKPIIHTKNYRENGELKSIYQYYDHESEDKRVRVPKWCLYYLISALLLVLMILLAAFIVVFYAPRPALHQENCEMRSCFKPLNLKCLNRVCVCDTGYFYLLGCIPKKNYMERCHLSSYCKDDRNMVCLDGSCKCNETKYWNGSLCVNKGTLNHKCNNDDECLGNTYLYCDKNTGKCSCDSKRFFDGAVCYPKQTYGESCVSTVGCQEWRSLLCTSGTCLCNSTMFWETSSSRCLKYFTYNTETCTNTSQCNPSANLICRLNSQSCNCPRSVPNNKCDCPNRVSGDEWYWNNTHCVPAVTYGTACQATYMCQYLTEFTRCDTVSRTCVCSSNGVWFSNQCYYCDFGYQYTRSHCFRTSSGFLTDHPTIVTGCYNRSDAVMGKLINEDLSVLNLANDLYIDDSLVLASYDASYWCSNTTGLCTLYSNRDCFYKHDCGHPHRYICQYRLI